MTEQAHYGEPIELTPGATTRTITVTAPPAEPTERGSTRYRFTVAALTTLLEILASGMLIMFTCGLAHTDAPTIPAFGYLTCLLAAAAVYSIIRGARPITVPLPKKSKT